MDSPLVLSKTIEKVEFQGALQTHHGKVRDSFVFEKCRAIVVSDRISAFDFILGIIPHKGAVLNQIAAWWFKQIDQIGIPHHLIEMPHPNICVVKNARVLPIEIVVRGYLTGTTKTSSWYAYQHLGREICGIKMPAGMKKNQQFDQHILTPTTKPDQGHDESISKQQILDRGLLAPFVALTAKSELEIWALIEQTALKLFAYGQKIAAEKGLILVDTKYEMGVDEQGQLMVVDEVHTPDSSRYWIASSYQKKLAADQEPDSLDKEFVRRMLVSAGYNVDSDENPAIYLTDEIKRQASEKYIQLFETMTGTKPVLTVQTPMADILQKLALG